MVLVLPAAGMAQDDTIAPVENKAPQKENASPAMSRPDAGAAQDNTIAPAEDGGLEKENATAVEAQPDASAAQDDAIAPAENNRLEKEDAATGPVQPGEGATQADAKSRGKADAPSTVYLDSMVVTATRTAHNLEEVPAAVSVIDTEEMETVKFVDSRKELLKRIPGYSMIRNLRIPMGGKNYTINLIDGLAVSSAFGSGTIGSADDTNTFDIERIEVVKGPASALYGSNALGGVINVITRKPPKEPEYRLWGEGGVFNRGRGGASAAGSTRLLGYFLDANILDYDGSQERTANEQKQISGKLLFDFDASSLTLRSEYIDKYRENPGSLSKKKYDEDWQQAEVKDAYNDEQSLSLSAKYERDLGNDSGMELSYGYRNTDSEGPPSYSASGGFGSSDVTNQNVVGIYRNGFDFLRSELIAGVDLQHSASDSDTYDERTVDSDIVQHWDIVAVVTSPFLQYEMSPTERLRISAGARYDNIRYSATGYAIDRFGVRTDYDEIALFSHLSPKAGITLDLGREQSVWLGYGQGFVVPSRTYLFTGSRGNQPNPDLDPEKADNYEIGLRGKLMDARLSYDITAYRTDITDMLVADDEIELYVNAGEVRVQGVETAIGYALGYHWRFDIAHTYADNKYIDFISGDDDYSGNTLSASPEHHLNARATWMPILGLSVELEWNRISSYYTSAGNDDPKGKAKRPDLFNLRLSYETGSWTFWAHALNVLDTKYAERVSYSSSDGREFTSGEPLNFYAGLSYTFK
jgi:iron complex outermembrane receptor protein